MRKFSCNKFRFGHKNLPKKLIVKRPLPYLTFSPKNLIQCRYLFYNYLEHGLHGVIFEEDKDKDVNPNPLILSKDEIVNGKFVKNAVSGDAIK